MKECSWDARPLYERHIEPLRARARELGYALGVHGTLKRDIDLIACPWIPEAVDARTLAEALLAVAARHNEGLAFLKPHEDNGYFWAGCPGNKPHGRLCWTFHLGGGPYLDLSVMPRSGDCHYATGAEIVRAREEAEERGPLKSYVATGGDGVTLCTVCKKAFLPQDDDAVCPSCWEGMTTHIPTLLAQRSDSRNSPTSQPEQPPNKASV